MKSDRLPCTNMQALTLALHATQPPVLATMKIDIQPNGLEVLHVEFVMTPELIKAWGEQCAEMVERRKT